MGKLEKKIKEEPWEGLSINLAVKAFLEDYPNSKISEFAKYLPLHDVIRIIYYCSGQDIYVSKDSGRLKEQLKGKISSHSYKNFFKRYKGKRFYVPEYQIVENSWRNSLIFKALKRDNSLYNRQRMAKKFEISMRQLARIYRHGMRKDKRKKEEKERQELDKFLRK